MSIEMESGEVLDQDTQETLAELKARGFEIEGEKKPEPEKVEAPKAEEAKPAPKVEVAPKEQPKTEDKTDELPEDESPKVERQVKAVPVRKYNELRHELQETKRLLEEKTKAQVSPTETKATPEVTEAVKALAQKHGIEDASLLTELASTIADAVGRTATLPDDYKQAIDKMREMTVQQQEELAFAKDFDTVSQEFPQLSDFKDKIKQLAYTEGYEKTPLRLIALEYMHDAGMFEQGKATMEKSTASGATRGAEVVDFDQVTEDQFKQMTDEQQAKFIQYQVDKENKLAEG